MAWLRAGAQGAVRHNATALRHLTHKVIKLAANALHPRVTAV